VRRKRITVQGIVQGVGFRPFIYRLAHELGLSGWVKNTPDGVIIEVQGEGGVLEKFVEDIMLRKPPLSRITSILSEEMDPIPEESGFSIIGSSQEGDLRPVIPPDVAICEECEREIFDPSNRRYLYPFTNCTNCGPRFTIVEFIPYDRPKTTMKVFEMCEECKREYNDPLDRRFHAQPNACPVCGPRVWVEVSDAFDFKPSSLSLDGDPIAVVGRALSTGMIVAIKGLGGFHIACDARNDDAVSELRRRKGRAWKPFALMCSDLEEARRVVQISKREEEILTSPQRPILLARAREGNGISPLVAPKNPYLGVMLPYTPLHLILFRHSPQTLVMTSGNFSEEPIAYRNEEAKERLSYMVDLFLMHNRDIYVPCDDSVIKDMGLGTIMIRRSRGYVPTSVEIPLDSPPILSCGADMRNTFCVAFGREAVPSQHIGDLEWAETFSYYERAIDHMMGLLQVKPIAIICDMHPGYISTSYGMRRARELGIRTLMVQHHHAHLASCMAENGILSTCIGVAFDGTGYGEDGTIWGGEFFVGNPIDGFKRVAHLKPIPMPGGEAAIRRPLRMAWSYMRDSGLDPTGLLDEKEGRIIDVILERRANAPFTSSMGRLFDAVSAMIGVCTEETYEGQPAAELEMVATDVWDPSLPPYPWEAIELRDRILISLSPAIREIWHEHKKGEDPRLISARFHRTISEMIAGICSRISEETGIRDVVISGGVFQNSLLLSDSIRLLKELGLNPIIHREVPPNDGGISLGQALIGAAKLGG
jgi:hydrogenase maturation protein HypF